MDPVTFFLGIGIAVITLLLTVRQLRLQTVAISLQTASLEEDRKERATQRELRRTTLFSALQAELRAILSAAEADWSEYRGEDLSSPRVSQEGSSLASEGEIRHRLGFAWTPLPDDTIRQAINEAAVLGLTPQQIEKLQMLRGRIRRVNTLMSYKVGLYPALMDADIPKGLTVAQIYGPRPWAEERAAHLNNGLEAAVYSIIGDCKAILESSGFEPS